MTWISNFIVFFDSKFDFCSIGTNEGLDSVKPEYDNNSRAYFLWLKQIPLHDLAISVPNTFSMFQGLLYKILTKNTFQDHD